MMLNDETPLTLSFVQEDGINFCWFKMQKTVVKRIRSNRDNFVDFVNDIMDTLQQEFEPALVHLTIATSQPKLKKQIRAIVAKSGFASYSV